ncbi:MAG TPA: hypothetical protein VE553_06050 [Candidatus Binatia bacterium]|nr:hypothetical protein [Candidatus Binatia bacterium]
MKRNCLVLMAILVVCLGTVAPVLADVPNEGTVEEGVSVPGIALGFSRTQVEAAYGQPYYCQTYAIPDDAAYCTFRASGGGLASVRYAGVDGGFAHNSPEDRVVEIGWGEPLSAWTTTAGITATLAKEDPAAVLAAYPDADVTYNDFGLLESVVDWLQGIEVRWSYDGYTGQTHVSMAIFDPLASLPTSLETHIQDIEASGYRERGRRHIYVWALILDEHLQAATLASVDAVWTLPDGSTRPAFEDLVGLDGTAFFELTGKLSRGSYELRIVDVHLPDHTFNAEQSVLVASVYVK